MTILDFFASMFPYTDFHRLNADWILDQIKQYVDRIEAAISTVETATAAATAATAAANAATTAANTAATTANTAATTANTSAAAADAAAQRALDAIEHPVVMVTITGTWGSGSPIAAFQNGTASKTFQQLLTAYRSGSMIFAKVMELDVGEGVIYQLAYVDGTTYPVISFTNITAPQPQAHTKARYRQINISNANAVTGTSTEIPAE